MRKKTSNLLRLLLLLLALLIQPVMVSLLPPHISANASPGVPYQFQSSPTGHITNLTVTYASNAYDALNGTKASFQRNSTGHFELQNFAQAIGYNITHVDFKVRFEAEPGDEPDGDLYRILYKVDPATTETVLIDWTSAGHPLETYAWTDQPEPNDGVWSWIDITNIKLRIETNPVGTPDGAFLDVYEVWVTVHFSLPYMSVEPTNLIDPNLKPGSSFTLNITVEYVEKLWGYQFELSFNPAVLQGVSVANGPFLGSAGGKVLLAPGPGFNNTAGTLGLFAAALYPKTKFPTGGGVLANVTFQTIGYGKSEIIFGPNSGLLDQYGEWIIHEKENPDTMRHGYFDNTQLFVGPPRVRGVPVTESFTVNVSINGAEDLYSWSLFLNWSAPLLNATAIEEGDFLKTQTTNFYSEIHNEEGHVYINNTIIGPYSGVNGSGTLAILTFLVEDNGNTALHLYDTMLLNSSANTISISINDGWFTNVKHTLTIDTQLIDTTPLPKVTFTLDGTSYQTPFSQSLEEKEYTIVMPTEAHVGGAMYDFVNWTDGVTEAQRIIDLAMDTSLTANYRVGALRIHNINTGLDYSSIQGAIDADETLDGHTIIVEAGIFYESIGLDKSLKLIGEDPNTTIIDADAAATAIYVTADNVIISGFTVRNSTDQAIYLYDCKNSTITSNILTTLEGSGFGIQLEGSSPANPADKHTISNNIIITNDVGIYINYSNNNTITGNTITLASSYGLQLFYSANNTLNDNDISNNFLGLVLYEFSHSTLTENTIADNTYGLYIASNSHNLTFYHNNFINNIAAQVYIESVSLDNEWNNSYPSGGNYWSDYTGVDEKSGPDQDEPGSDGIGDTAHELDADNKDNYPIMSIWRGHVIIDQFMVSGNRVNVSSEQTVAFHAKWSLDGADVISGTIFVNGTGYSINATGWISFDIMYDTAGKRLWTVTGVSSNYISAYEYPIEDPYIIWDRIKIVEGGVTNVQTNVTQTETVWFRAVYEYDNTNFDVSSGTLYANGSLMTWSPSQNRWEYEYTFSTPGTRTFQISTVSDALYGLALINDAVGPLTITWNDFQITFLGTTYTIPITSNSTVSNMAFDPDAKQLSFNVEGPDGTVGFCNVSIPKTFMWGDWVVNVDDVPVDYTITEDDDYTYIYFTYTHSTHSVKMVSTHIVPEFPTLTSMLILLVALAAAIVTIFHRRATKHPSAMR